MAGIEKGVGFPITAVDQFSGAFDKLLGKVSQAQGAFSRLNGIMAGLGAGLSIGAFVAFAKHIVDAGDELNKLSQKTGIAVEQLSKLKYAADLSGVNTDALGKGLKGLAQSMVEANDKTSKVALLFKALGTDIRHGPQRALESLATSFAGLADGETKTALALEIFKKSGVDLIPFLNQGATGIRKLMEEAERLGVVWSGEAARAAEEFKDKLTAVKAAAEGAGRALFVGLADSLQRWAGAVKEAAAEGGALNVILVALGGVMAESIGLNDDALKRNERYIQRLRESRDGLLAMQKTGAEVLPGEKALIDKIQAEIEQWDKLQAARRAAAAALPKKDDGFVGPVLPPGKAEELARILADGKKVADLYRNELATASKTAAAAQLELERGTGNVTAAEKALLAVMEKPEWKQLAPRAKADIEAQYRKAEAIEREIRARKALGVMVAEAIQQGEEERRARADYLSQGDQIIKQLDLDRERYEAETEAIGLTSEAREIANLRFEKEIALRQSLEPYQREAIERLYEEREALILTRAAREEQLSLWNDIANRGSEFFADLATSGRNAFDVLRRAVKDFAKELIALFARRWILQLGAGMVGGSAGAALAGQAANVGAGTIGGSFLNAGGQLLAGGFGGASALGSFSQGVNIGLGIEGSGISQGFMGALGEGAAGIFGQFAQFLPYVGIILGGIALLASIFSKPRGGPKDEGQFTGMFSGSGSLLGQAPSAFNIVGTSANPAAQSYVAGAATAFGGILRSFGINEGFNLGVGIVRDPKGTSPTFIDTVLGIGGREVFRQHNANVGRSDEEMQAELALQTKRAFLAGLQASDLPAGIANILNMVAAETATEQQVDAVIGLAQAYKGLGDIIEDLGRSPLERLQLQLEGMKQRVTDAGIAFDAALQTGDPQQILAAEQELQTAILDRYQRELALIDQLRTAIRAVEEQAYQFALNIAGRINAVGGSRDIGGIAMGRANTLRGRIGGNAPLRFQIEDLQGYVGAIDTWYESRRTAIMQQIEAEQQAAQALAAAQTSAAQARIAALQEELAITQQFQALVDRAGQMLSSLRLTSANPLSAFGRLGLATSDVDSLRGAFGSATGIGKVTAGGKLLDALLARLGLLGEAFQRPSDEYMAGYNEIIREVTAIAAVAQTEAEKGLELQQQIVDIQNQILGYQAMAASAGVAGSAALAALDAEARGYYEWAESEGARLYALHEQNYRDQLTAITGGQDVDLYVADLTKQSRDLLEQIRDRLDAIGEESSGPPITVVVNNPGPGTSGEDIVNVIVQHAPTIRRALEHS